MRTFETIKQEFENMNHAGISPTNEEIEEYKLARKQEKDKNLKKIICVDNYDREDRSDVLVVESVHPFYGKYIVDMLNDKFGGEDSDSFFKLVDGDYKLYEFGGW